MLLSACLGSNLGRCDDGRELRGNADGDHGRLLGRDTTDADGTLKPRDGTLIDAALSQASLEPSPLRQRAYQARPEKVSRQNGVANSEIQGVGKCHDQVKSIIGRRAGDSGRISRDNRPRNRGHLARESIRRYIDPRDLERQGFQGTYDGAPDMPGTVKVKRVAGPRLGLDEPSWLPLPRGNQDHLARSFTGQHLTDRTENRQRPIGGECAIADALGRNARNKWANKEPL
jgi:hypothetical protein